MPCMECAHCRHRFSFVETLKIFTPWRFPCPACGARLRYGPKSYMVLVVSAFVGLAVVALFVSLVDVVHLSLRASLIWTAVACALGASASQLLLFVVGDTRAR